MGFWIYMLFMDLLLPFIMIGFAIVISILMNKTVILNIFYVLKKKVVKK